VQIPVLVSALDRPAFNRTQMLVFLSYGLCLLLCCSIYMHKFLLFSEPVAY